MKRQFPHPSDYPARGTLQSIVYFASSGCGKYYKVGYTGNPAQRHLGINRDARRYFGVDASAEYLGMVVASQLYEKAIRRYFAPRQVIPTNDWYHAHPEFLECIETIRHLFVDPAELPHIRRPDHVEVLEAVRAACSGFDPAVYLFSGQEPMLKIRVNNRHYALVLSEWQE